MAILDNVVLDMPNFNLGEVGGVDRFRDWSGYGNHGVPTNFAGTDVEIIDGQFGQAIQLNGVNQYLNCGNDTSVQIITSITVFTWINCVSQTSAIISKYDALINQRAWGLFANLAALGVVISDDGTSAAGHLKNYSFSIPVYDNNIHQVGFRFDSGTLTLFVDGIEDPNPVKNRDDAITTIHNTTSDLTIGCQWANIVASSFFSGVNYRTTINNSALTNTEIWKRFKYSKHGS